MHHCHIHRVVLYSQKSHKNLAIKLLGSPYILFNVYNVFKEATVIQVPDSSSGSSSSKTNFCAWVFLKHTVSRLQPAKCCFIKKRRLWDTPCQRSLFQEGKCSYAGKSQLLFSANEIWGKTTTKHFVHCMPLPWKRHCEEEKLLFLEIVLCFKGSCSMSVYI